MGLLGSIGEVGPRAVFPLSGLSAETQARGRVALVGEAAHVIPPIGAQGLNLSLRDAGTLADCVADALRDKRDIGGPETLARYAAARGGDVTQRIWTVDLLNRSLISALAPVHLARAAGLAALATVGPLRRFVVREGVQPALATPSLMQADGSARLEARLTGRDAAPGPVA
jgi:2-octaprenyl-6-methoxyphenol hydroxylase